MNAAIVAEEKILLIRFDDENGPHYNLPGGGVDEGESLHQALVRECREEASVEVEPGEVPALPAKPDPHQVGVEWVPLEALEDLPGSKYPPVFPEFGPRLLAAVRGQSRPFFEGHERP